MCRPKPFPRCSHHARQQLTVATARLAEMEAGATDGTITDPARVERAREAQARALEEYETCPENIRNLKNVLTAALEEEQGDTETTNAVRQALEKVEARRELLIHNAELQGKAQQRLNTHQNEIRDLEARANRDLTPEVLATEQASLDMENARDAVTETSNVIARQYADVGNSSYAWNPGLWALDHENPDGDRTAEYQEYVSAKESLADAEHSYETARRAESMAKLQLSVDKVNLNRRKAEIASGLYDGNTYEAYGAAMINPDGATNARYLTTIPGTDTVYYAKVMQVRGNIASLETGQQLPLRATRQSDWKYTIPEAGATRGPELYRMDSSG